MSAQVNTSTNFDPRLFLRDEELDRGVALILSGERILSAAAESGRRTAALNKTELQAILAIRAAPGLSVTDLRDRLGTTTPTMARVLGKLDTRGLIRRKKSGQDGRKRKLELSLTGKAISDPIAEAMRNSLRAAYRSAGSENVSGARVVLEALADE